MIWFEIILFLLIIIGAYNYQKNWTPIHPFLHFHENIMKIGHRGAPLLAQENTLSSFKKAIEAGVDGIELDVQQSSDGKLVVFHDWDLSNLTGSNKKIESLSSMDISNITFPNESEKKCIPLFSEVVEILPKKCLLIIEIKSAHILNTGIEKNLLQVITNYNIEKKCIVSSFNPFVLRRIKIINPIVNTALLWSQYSQFIINSPLWVWFCRPDGVHIDINYLEKELIDWVRKKSLSLFTFTVNNKKDLDKALSLRVDGFFTDDPYIN